MAKVYVWHKVGAEYYLSVDQPRVAEEDDFGCGVRKGDIVPSALSTVVSTMPDDMQPFLPSGSEIRPMWFHVDLWGRAKVLASYDKKHWMTLQKMLGD